MSVAQRPSSPRLDALISVVITCKDEPLLADTLTALEGKLARCDLESEIVVVDASEGRLDDIRQSHPRIRWLDFRPPAGVEVSIPHQRNRGVEATTGDVIAFTDCGCIPDDGWAESITTPIVAGAESVTVGRTVGSGLVNMYDAWAVDPPPYVDEAPTINMAFARAAFDRVGGFDESFSYGSDIDFCWRLCDAGYRIRLVPEAIVRADWGSRRRQLRRAWSYGRARARLYRKHHGRLRVAWRADPLPFGYGLFVLSLPLARRFPWYLLILVLPAIRNRRTGALLTVADHILLGAGFLRGLVGP